MVSLAYIFSKYQHGVVITFGFLFSGIKALAEHFQHV